MRKHEDKTKIEQLNQSIDELIQGRLPKGDADELQLLQRLNNLYQDEKEAKVVMKRLYPKVVTVENNKNAGSYWRHICQKSFAIPALTMVLAVCLLTGVYIKTLNKGHEGTTTIQIAETTRNPKTTVTNVIADTVQNTYRSIPQQLATEDKVGTAQSESKNENTAIISEEKPSAAVPSALPAEPEVQQRVTNGNVNKKKSDLSDWAGGDMYFYFDSSEQGLIESQGTFMVDKPKDQSFLTESYDRISESRFHSPIDEPLSTFSVDVDTASYANVRRFINQGQVPPKDTVRIEEMLNYFTYDYPKPANGRPFSVMAEMGECPWNKEHQLVRIGLQGRKIDLASAPPNNLVFLLDVSGSMEEPNKLPLVKASIRLLVQEMRPQDQVSMVVYAGAAGMVLPSTSGRDKEKILAALDGLEAGGSTAGGEGIQLAYKAARDSFIKHGNNRVILATDGDFNIGASSDGEMERLIEKEREDGIFLSVLGFGMGNYKDSKMEKLADKGNGNYAYIDSLQEARKVLVDQMGGTLVTIAKDVKIQVEFNPAKIRSYRLIGYENRILANEDFDDDKKDAGEIGSGHSVTALYEVDLNNGTETKGRDLKYQKTSVKDESYQSKEYLSVKLRYKEPKGIKSKLINVTLTKAPLTLASCSKDFRFAAAVAAFGMILRDSEFKGKADSYMVLRLAGDGRGKDVGEYRKGFIDMVKNYQSFAEQLLK